jgi:ribonuclease P protein component
VLATADRLRRRDEFAATIKSGGRVARGAVVVHLNLGRTDDPVLVQDRATAEYLDDPARAERSRPSARAGFVVSKAVGGAVVRNKVKRRLRHVMRARLMDLPDGTDIVVRALPAAATRPYADLENDVIHALDAAVKRVRRQRQ